MAARRATRTQPTHDTHAAQTVREEVEVENLGQLVPVVSQLTDRSTETDWVSAGADANRKNFCADCALRRATDPPDDASTKSGPRARRATRPTGQAMARVALSDAAVVAVTRACLLGSE